MKKSTKILLGAAAVGAAAYISVGEVLYRKFLTAAAVRGGNGALTHSEPVLRALDIEAEEWYIDTPKQHWEAPSKRGGETIHAEVLLNGSGSDVFAICIHGYNASPETVTPIARHFYEKGYNVMLPSLCGHGRSEAPYASMGWLDRIDICRWIEEILDFNPDARIILHGVSMGAATVMMTLGENLPSNVVCAIEDCGYTSVVDQFTHVIENVMKLPPFPYLRSADIATRIHAGYSLYDASSIEQIKKSKTPTLFVHGSADNFVPFRMLEECYNAASSEKEMHIFEGSKHSNSIYDHTEEYFETVDSFVEKYIKS